MRGEWPPRLSAIGHHGRVVIPEPAPDKRRRREPDVLALVPAPRDIARLDRIFALDAASSPVERLALWEPDDPADYEFRRFLLDFAYRVLESAGAVRRPTPP